MSGIWGYYSSEEQNEQQIHALEYWTRCYGNEGADQVRLDKCSLGCHIEHFSDGIPCSKKILAYKQYKAVIDVILYNRDEIIHLLSINSTESYSDEELLFRLYLEKGFEAFAEVNGDFAGAIYDENNRTWTLFRDHLGIRPLFYYIDEKQFVFSTDIRSITSCPEVDCALDEVRFYQEVAGYNALRLLGTEYKYINCVQPAARMIVDCKGPEFTKKTDVYWKLGQKKIRLKNDLEYQKELRRLITDSIERRLKAVSGVVGAELSGGLDSSIIDILINRTKREAVYYSWSYDPNDHALSEERDERQIIIDICKQENITCKYTPIPKLEEIEDINTMLSRIEPPFLNTPLLSKGSKWMHEQGANVVFTGHGGDEGVSHRCNLFEIWFHKEYASFFKVIYRRTKGKKLRLLRTMSKAFKQVTKTNKHFLAPYYSEINAEDILNSHFIDEVGKNAPKPALEFAFNPIGYTMQGGPRVRLDNIAFQGAENGVRYIVPYMDYRVFDYAVSIPRCQYQSGYGNRWIFRQAFNDIMPQSLKDMKYKDMPSMNKFHLQNVNYEKEFLETKQQLIDFLDWDFWGAYLNRDAVDSIVPVDRNDFDKYAHNYMKINALVLCARIQNAVIGGRKWCESHE